MEYCRNGQALCTTDIFTVILGTAQVLVIRWMMDQFLVTQ